MQKKILALTLSVAIAFSVGMTAVNADDLDKLQQEQKKIEQQIKNNRQQQDEAKKIQNQIKNEQAALDQKIEKAKQELAAASAQINENSRKLSQTEEELRAAEETTTAHRGQLDERIRTMYKRGNEDYLAVILNSTSFSEFISRTEMVSRLVNYDMNKLEELYEQQQAIEKMKEELETQRKEIVYWEQQAKRKENELQIADRQKADYMQRVKADLAKLEAQEKAFLEESNKLTTIIRNMQSSAVYAGGALTWPTPGYYYITSPFGNRKDPISGAPRFHTGIDVGVPMGKNVVASAEGKVVIAGWLGGYGYTVLIDHGSNMMTLYAHNSRLEVQVGQYVARGQVIAKIGSTGYSTGPHLHYEVRKNGNYENPMNYLKK